MFDLVVNLFPFAALFCCFIFCIVESFIAYVAFLNLNATKSHMGRMIAERESHMGRMIAERDAYIKELHALLQQHGANKPQIFNGEKNEKN